MYRSKFTVALTVIALAIVAVAAAWITKIQSLRRNCEIAAGLANSLTLGSATAEQLRSLPNRQDIECSQPLCNQRVTFTNGQLPHWLRGEQITYVVDFRITEGHVTGTSQAMFIGVGSGLPFVS